MLSPPAAATVTLFEMTPFLFMTQTCAPFSAPTGNVTVNGAIGLHCTMVSGAAVKSAVLSGVSVRPPPLPSLMTMVFPPCANPTPAVAVVDGDDVLSLVVGGAGAPAAVEGVDAAG